MTSGELDQAVTMIHPVSSGRKLLNALKIILLVVFGLLLVLAATQIVIGKVYPIAEDYRTYCRAADKFPSASMYDRVDVTDQLPYRYSPPFAWFMQVIGCQSEIGWMFASAAAYGLGLFLLYRSEVFRPLRSWVMGGITNSTIVTVFSFLSVSLFLFPAGIAAALLIYANASVWLVALAVLPALLTKPHWAIFFLSLIWMKKPKYIALTAAAILIEYGAVVLITSLLIPHGWELWQVYWRFLLKDNIIAFTALPTWQQGLHQWMVFLMGNTTVVNWLYRAVWLVILINYPIQVWRILKADENLRPARLLALTILTAMLLIPDLQEIVLAFICMGVIMITPVASSAERIFRAVLWVVYIIWCSYALTGAPAIMLALPETSIWYKILLFQTYTPITLVTGLLLLIGVSWSAMRAPREREAPPPMPATV
jgi:hypothetical protein